MMDNRVNVINTRPISLLTVLFVVSVFLAGCGGAVDPSAKGVSETEPNDAFSQAQTLDRTALLSKDLYGDLSDNDDIDVFDLGTLNADQVFSVFFTADRTDYDSYVVIGLFDSEGNLAMLSDDLSCQTQEASAFSHHVVKTDQYYLAVAFAYEWGNSALGYSLRIVIDSSSTSYQPSSQGVYLDFDGATNIRLDTLRWAELAPLSDALSQARARAVAETILDILTDDYAGFDIQFASSYDVAEPSAAHTVVYVTGSEDDYYGLAESTDWYNADSEDFAIVFAGNFTGRGWSDDQIAQAAGNVVSHELGHLLGLVHTDDDSEIMDETTPDYRLRMDQDFHQASLADFPIGYLDALELLEFILGLTD